MYKTYFWFSFFVLSGILWRAFPVHAGTACDFQSLASVSYDVSFKDPSFEYEYKAGAISQDNGLWMAVGASDKGQPPGLSQTLRLWKLDAAGQKTQDIALSALLGSEEHLGQLADIEDVAALADGGAVIVLLPGSGYSVLIRVNAEGGLAAIWPIQRQPREAIIKRVLPTLDDHLLAVGSLSGKPFFLKLTPDGEVAVEKTVDTLQEQMSGFFDGAMAPDGEFILLSKGQTPESPRIGISRYNTIGEGRFENASNGYMGTIAGMSDTGYAVASDHILSGTRDVFLRKYDEQLQEIWHVNIHQAPVPKVPPSVPTKVAKTADGGFFLAAKESQQLFLARINSAGTPIWNCLVERQDNLDFLWNFGLLSSQDTFILPLTRFTSETINGAIWQRQEVRVVRFRLDAPAP